MSMADDNDRASLVEEQFREAAIRAASPTPHPKGFDGKTCYDCGDDIPQARLDFGAFRCIYCQERNEKRGYLGVRR